MQAVVACCATTHETDADTQPTGIPQAHPQGSHVGDEFHVLLCRRIHQRLKSSTSAPVCLSTQQGDAPRAQVSSAAGGFCREDEGDVCNMRRNCAVHRRSATALLSTANCLRLLRTADRKLERTRSPKELR